MLLGLIPLPLLALATVGYAKTKPLMDLLMTASAVASSVAFWWFFKTRPPGVAVAVEPQPKTVAVTRYYLYQADVQSGPFTIAELRQMASSGAILPGALYAFDDATDWQPIAKLKRMLG